MAHRPDCACLDGGCIDPHPSRRQPIPIVREQTFAKPSALADLSLDPVDAMMTGQTLRALARNKKVGPSAREVLGRVGEQLWAAARLAMAGDK